MLTFEIEDAKQLRVNLMKLSSIIDRLIKLNTYTDKQIESCKKYYELLDNINVNGIKPPKGYKREYYYKVIFDIKSKIQYVISKDIENRDK